MSETKYWEVPFEVVLLERQAHIERVLSLACQGLSMLTDAPKLMRVLRKEEEAIKAAEDDAEFLSREVDEGFPSLFSQAAVMLWGGLEAAVRDFMVRWLESYDQARQSERIGKVKISLSTYEELPPDERMRFLLEAVEQDLGARFKSGVTQFEVVLEVLGVEGDAGREGRRDLLELAAVRNVIVHQAGTADARFLRQAPWLSFAIGDQVAVSRDEYTRYHGATVQYAINVLERAHAVAARWDSQESHEEAQQ